MPDFPIPKEDLAALNDAIQDFLDKWGAVAPLDLRHHLCESSDLLFARQMQPRADYQELTIEFEDYPNVYLIKSDPEPENHLERWLKKLGIR